MTPSLLAQILARDPRKTVRFPEVPVDEALDALRQLHDALREPTPAPPPPAVAAPVAPAPAAEDTEALSAALGGLATQVWRARSRIIDPATGEPREEMKRVHRHIEGALDVLKQLGLTMNDWVHQPYDAGLPVKVLAFQPTPGLARDTILEAVRPTVIWKERLLQLGEVVVGIPVSPEDRPR
jgi:hypothetical protein